MSDNIQNEEVHEVFNNLIQRIQEIDNIDHIQGEEKPLAIVDFIKLYFNIDQEITIKEYPDNSTKYIITIYNIEIIYTICDSNGSSPDLIIYMKNGKHIFCEDTKAGFCGSANNAQFQRFTKFVTVLVNEKYHKVYYLDNKDGHQQINEYNINKEKHNKTIVAMRLWKTCNIELITNNPILQTNFNNLIKPYKDLEELIKYWNLASDKTTNGMTKGNIWNISYENNKIILSGFVVTKKTNGKITLAHDPGIGTLLLVICSCISFGVSEFMIDNKICERSDHDNCISQNMINTTRETTMKLINSILVIQDTFECSIEINNIIIPDKLPSYETFFNCETKSEKVVSIWEENTLDNVIFVNHARGTLEHIKIPNKSEYCMPNEVYTPDIIWIDDNTRTIYFVEAEKYENYKKGYKQILSWKSGPKSVTTREFFKKIFWDTPYKDYSHKAYITLYIQDIQIYLNSINNITHVKHILDSTRKVITNANVEYLDLNN